MNIEDVAAENPDAILKIPIDIVEGLSEAKALAVAEKLGFGDRAKEISGMFLNVYKLFTTTDALMVELNPLAEDSNGECEFINDMSLLCPTNQCCNQITFPTQSSASTQRSDSTTTQTFANRKSFHTETGLKRTRKK